MQKKTLFLMLLLSGKAFSATMELGFENEQYNHSYDTSDMFAPYISTSFDPIEDSKLNVSMKYMFQDQYGKKHADTQKDKFKTNRDRVEVYFKGYTWKNGNFSFSPQAGFRYEQWDINYLSTSKQDSNKLELRFFPNMNYKINDSTSLYLSGFVAPVFMETKQQSRKDGHYDSAKLSTNHYNGDYYQEMQLLGIKHKINDKNGIWSSIYNERKYTEYSSKYDRWQLRVGYELKAMQDLNINPFIRYDLYYNEENIEKTKDNGKSRSKDEVRIGSTFNYSMTKTFNLVGEVYWQTAKVESYNGVSSDDKNRMFYKLAVRKSF